MQTADGGSIRRRSKCESGSDMEVLLPGWSEDLRLHVASWLGPLVCSVFREGHVFELALVWRFHGTGGPGVVGGRFPFRSVPCLATKLPYVLTKTATSNLQDLQDLVAKCLQKDPAGRTSADKLAKHRFFKVRAAVSESRARNTKWRTCAAVLSSRHKLLRSGGAVC